MSSGPRHYAAAEAILKDLDDRVKATQARGMIPRDELRQVTADWGVSLQAAQVHATLALAAATAESNATPGEWARALAV